MELHHDKHHAGYVKGANETLEKAREMRGKGDLSLVSMLENNLAFHDRATSCTRCSGPTISPNGGDPNGDLADLLDDTFGGVGVFRQQMHEAAATLQGSGWALASWEPVVGTSSTRTARPSSSTPSGTSSAWDGVTRQLGHAIVMGARHQGCSRHGHRSG